MKKILVKTAGMSREEWKRWRLKGIGGSDASVILGLSPWKSSLELWREKTGQIPLEENENDYLHFGHVMEPIIKKEFQARTGLKVRAKNMIIQGEYEFMLANLDGVVKEKDGSYSIFEAKTAGEHKRKIWEKGPDPIYLPQIYHYMVCTGFRKAHVCALVGGNTFYHYVVNWDESYAKYLIQKEQVFWDCVVKGIPPKADASKATGEYLDQYYARAERSEIVLPDDAILLVDSYLEVEENLKQLTKQKQLLTNQLKVMLEDHEKGRVQGHTVSWTNVEKHSIDTKKVKEFLGNSYDDFLAVSSYRKFSVA